MQILFSSLNENKSTMRIFHKNINGFRQKSGRKGMGKAGAIALAMKSTVPLISEHRLETVKNSYTFHWVDLFIYL